MSTKNIAKYYSQFEEDKFIANYLAQHAIDFHRLHFCEFGAWDGYRFSNIMSFVQQGAKGTFIEGDKNRFQLLQTNTQKLNTTNIHSFVSTTGPDTLDQLVKQPIDILSIDIDGDDIHILKSLREHEPIIIIIEYNPTIPHDLAYENPLGQQVGSSALSIIQYAKTKGYKLIKQTPTNLILTNLIGEDVSLKLIEGNTRYFFGYDGSLLNSTSQENRNNEFFKIPWNNYIGKQPVPKAFRNFTDSKIIRLTAKFTSLLTIIITRPIELVKWFK